MNKQVLLDAVKRIEVPTFTNPTGDLSVFQGGDSIPFSIARVFTVSTEANEQRGGHAHRECTQFLVAVSGKVTVVVDDGVGRDEFTLDSGGVGLLIPPGIWAEQTYMEDGTVLMVLCSHAYDQGDYIRDYDKFVKRRDKA